MVKFGFCTPEQFLRAGAQRRYSGAHAAYNLLDVGDHPSEEQIRAFEDVSFTLQTSNGTFRRTFQNRFRDVDAATMRWMEQLFSNKPEVEVQDRAVSHGLTTWEWAGRVFRLFPRARFEASDILMELIELSRGRETYILEPGGQPLQYVRAPFAVSLAHPEPRRYPVNQLVALRARKRFAKLGLGPERVKAAEASGWRLRRFPCIHPLARTLAQQNSNFQFRLRSVFDETPGNCDVLRTMNIFNRAYFATEDLERGASAVFRSLRWGGMWVVGRTWDHDFTNHASLFLKSERGWELLERIGSGWEMESAALSGVWR